MTDSIDHAVATLMNERDRLVRYLEQMAPDLLSGAWAGTVRHRLAETEEAIRRLEECPKTTP